MEGGLSEACEDLISASPEHRVIDDPVTPMKVMLL